MTIFIVACVTLLSLILFVYYLFHNSVAMGYLHDNFYTVLLFLFSNMADNEFGLTDSEMAQLMNEVADCLGPDLVNQLISEAQVLQPDGQSQYFI